MSRKREFALPLFNRLNKDQLKAIHLPKGGAHLVIGGPGTGKSVVALFRVREVHGGSKGTDCCFLVYNRLLLEASQQLMGSSLQSSTWIAWFKRLFRELADRPVRLRDGKPWNIDWDDVACWLAEQEKNPEPPVDYLIIDEGQDMPPIFYETLWNLGFVNIYVVADQNQQIGEQHSSRQDLQNVLLIDTEKVIELKLNYRNTYPIARLAREFYTGDPATPAPELPVKGATLNTPFLVEYGETGNLDLHRVVRKILVTSDNYPAKLIGVLTPNDKVRKRYLQLLEEEAGRMNLALKPHITTYCTEERDDCSFGEGGIFVLNAQACKGLEFDIVFLADIHEYYCNETIADKQKRLFYVMIARAKEKVFLLKRAGHCQIDKILPSDHSVLQRWKGNSHEQ